MLKIGFMGVGHMARAMIAGIHRTHPTWQLSGFDHHPEKLTALTTQYQLIIAERLEELADTCDYLVIAVKPQNYDAALAALRPYLKPSHVVITVAVGYSLHRIKEHLESNSKIIRTMPNAPALVGSAMSAMVANGNLTEEEKTGGNAIFASFGQVVWLEEKYFDIFSAISGSLPAYICMMIEALSDAAVRHGLPRAQSYAILNQAILGSAKWVQESSLHPASLKDQVCSPGGTTIAGVTALEKGQLRNTLISAINACMRRTKELSQS